MDLKNRKSIRLKGFNYSSNEAYFVTICTKNREYLFGDIVDGKMVLNQYGEITDKTLKLLSKRFPVEIDTYQIMPNHIHMIIIVGAIHESPHDTRAHRDAPLQKRSLLSQIIGFLKMNSSKSIHQMDRNLPVWQRNYYEHIIRNEKELYKIREYITLNPLMWERDRNNNPENIYV